MRAFMEIVTDIYKTIYVFLRKKTNSTESYFKIKTNLTTKRKEFSRTKMTWQGSYENSLLRNSLN